MNDAAIGHAVEDRHCRVVSSYGFSVVASNNGCVDLLDVGANH
jgi:hypothetical protein